jgi:hypothetical protein
MMFSTTHCGICLIPFDLPDEIPEQAWRVFRAMWAGPKARLR